MNAVVLHRFHLCPVYPSLRVGDIDTMILILRWDINIKALVSDVMGVLAAVITQPLPG